MRTQHISDAAGQGGPVDDIELLRRARAGCMESYGTLWTRYLSLAYSTVHKIHSSRRRVDADEVVSESFLQILQAIRGGNGPTDSFPSYLIATVRNRTMRAVTAEDTANTDLDELEDPNLNDDPISRLFENESVAQAFKQLPDRWREVLWLTEVEQLPNTDIAARMDLKVNSVAQLAFRARNGLRDAWLEANLKRVTARSPECESTLSRLSAYARGKLSASRNARIERHAASCPTCGPALQEAVNIASRLNGLLPLAVVAGAGATAALWQPGSTAAAAAQAGPALAGQVSGQTAAGWTTILTKGSLPLWGKLAALGATLSLLGASAFIWLSGWNAPTFAGYVATASVPVHETEVDPEDSHTAKKKRERERKDERGEGRKNAAEKQAGPASQQPGGQGGEGVALSSAQLTDQAAGATVDPATVIGVEWTIKVPAGSVRAGDTATFTLPAVLSGQAQNVSATDQNGAVIGALSGSGRSFTLVFNEAAAGGSDRTAVLALHASPELASWGNGVSSPIAISLGETSVSAGNLTLSYAPGMLFAESLRVAQQRSSPQHDLSVTYTSPLHGASDVGVTQALTVSLDAGTRSRAALNCAAIRGSANGTGASYAYGPNTAQTSAYLVAGAADPLGMQVTACSPTAVTLSYTPRHANHGFSLELVSRQRAGLVQSGDALQLTPKAAKDRVAEHITVHAHRSAANGASAQTSAATSFTWPD